MLWGSLFFETAAAFYYEIAIGSEQAEYRGAFDFACLEESLDCIEKVKKWVGKD